MRKSALPNLAEKTMVDYDNMLFGYLPRCGSAGNNIEVCWMGLLLTTKKADKNEGAKMVDQHFHEQFFMEKLLTILQLEPEEESLLKAFIAAEGTEVFFKQYDQIALSSDTKLKLRALIALLEADYEA